MCGFGDMPLHVQLLPLLLLGLWLNMLQLWYGVQLGGGLLTTTLWLGESHYQCLLPSICYTWFTVMIVSSHLIPSKSYQFVPFIQPIMARPVTSSFN